MMYKVLILFLMLFCHIVDDYYLQGWLASAKQKSWWEKNAPDKLYKNDYLMALVEHAFSWTFMIHFPLIMIMVITSKCIALPLFLVMFVINWVTHIITDNAKANLLKINLVSDQIIHVLQIILTWIVYMVVV